MAQKDIQDILVCCQPPPPGAHEGVPLLYPMDANIALSSDMANAAANYAMSVISHNNERRSDIRIFNNPQFGEIRTTMTSNGEPLFCLADVCSILDLTAKVVNQRLDDGVVSKYPIRDTLGREQLALFVNEDGLYDVVLDSRKPEAKKFRKWVTSEVLPSIRKTGSYSLPLCETSPTNPQLQYVQTQLYLADALADRLRMNEVSRLGMYQSIAEPYRIPIPQYVASKGVKKSAKELLAELGSDLSVIRFNQMLVKHGFLDTLTRRSKSGKIKKFKNVTEKGKAYGENDVNFKNPNETQPHWYADRFTELYNIVTA